VFRIKQQLSQNRKKALCKKKSFAANVDSECWGALLQAKILGCMVHPPPAILHAL